MEHKNERQDRVVIRIIKESDLRIDDYVVAFPFDGCDPNEIPCFNSMEGYFSMSWEELRKTSKAHGYSLGEILADISRFNLFVKVEDRLPSLAQMKKMADVAKGKGGCKVRSFEQFLRKHFGLETALHSGKKWDENDPNYDVQDQYTAQDWDAWGRVLAMMADMVSIGIMDKETETRIAERICDIA